MERFEVREYAKNGTFVIRDRHTGSLVGPTCNTATEFATAEEAHLWVPAVVIVDGIPTF